MKITSFVAIAVALALGTTAHAGRRAFSSMGSDYVSNGKFGLGLELGEPTGLNGKLFLTPSNALDFGIGEVYQNYYVNGTGFHLYADYLWHPTQLAQSEAFKLPFYIGVGGRAWFFDYGCPTTGPCATSAQVIGVRVPVGLDFDFNNVPLDIFGQFVPTLDFYRNYNNRSVYLDVDFSVGIRYWFS